MAFGDARHRWNMGEKDTRHFGDSGYLIKSAGEGFNQIAKPLAKAANARIKERERLATIEAKAKLKAKKVKPKKEPVEPEPQRPEAVMKPLVVQSYAMGGPSKPGWRRAMAPQGAPGQHPFLNPTQFAPRRVTTVYRDDV